MSVGDPWVQGVTDPSEVELAVGARRYNPFPWDWGEYEEVRGVMRDTGGGGRVLLIDLNGISLWRFGFGN